MKPARQFLTRLALNWLTVSLLSCAAFGQTVKFSAEPVASTASNVDNLLLNQSTDGGATFTTKRIAVSTFAASPGVTNALVARTETNAFGFTNDSRTLTQTNTNNLWAASFFWFNPFPSGSAFGLVWTNGQLLCPQDTGIGFAGGLWINSGHGTDYGNGTEWQISGNQFGLQVTDGNHVQLGSSIATIGNAFTLNSGLFSGNNASNRSAILNFKSRFGSSGNFKLEGFWQDTWDPTNGGTFLHGTVDGQNTWSDRGRDTWGVDSDNGFQINYYTRTGFTNTINDGIVGGGFYNLNWTNQSTVRVDVSAALP